MKSRHTFRGVIVATLAVITLTAAGRTMGEEKHSAAPPQGGSTLSMARFYSGTIGRTGEFPGKLVCLRCDLKPGPGAMAECQKEGHRHALGMEGEGMIHPLLAGTETVLKQINSGELHGKDVTVHGKYYPATGTILVDRMAARK